MVSRRVVALVAALTAIGSVQAFNWNDSVMYRGEAVFSFAGGQHTPFWLVNNQQGMSSLKKNNGYLRLGAFKEMHYDKRFSWGAGIELAAGYRQESPFFIQQAYAEVRYRCLDAMFGAKEMNGEMVNQRLSSGNLLYSGNARPIPQLRIGIFDYADIWGTKGLIGIKGYLAYGKFTDSGWQKSWAKVDHVKNPDGTVTDWQQRNEGVWYHSKGLWLRGGNRDLFPLVGEAGIEMATQFGGTGYVCDKGVWKKITMPTNLKAWWKALVPLEGDDSTIAGEQTNVQGNFIGNFTFSLSWLPKADWSVKLYYQHLFEDHSMMYVEYPWKDGMWGLEGHLPKNPFVSAIVYEFLYMKDQSGPVYWDHTDKNNVQVSARDNYFNHAIYSSWQHWGQIIGSPLILSPIYNNGTLTLRSNRVVAHHLGFEGQPLNELGYRVLLSYSRNWGTYQSPLPEVEDNFNALVELTWTPKKLKGWQGVFSFGADAGDLIGRSVGVQIGIVKSGKLF